MTPAVTRVYDRASGQTVTEFRDGPPWIGTAVFSPDGAHVLTAILPRA